MKPEFADTSTGKTAVFLKRGSAENAICFLHGNSLNSSFFKNIWSSEALSDYTLIAIDFPGHGASEKPYDELRYNLPSYVLQVQQVLKNHQIKNVILVGHSLGGHVAIGVAKNSENSVKGLMITGTPPLGNPPDLASAFIPSEEMGWMFQGEWSGEQISRLALAIIQKKDDAPQLETMLAETLPLARTSLAAWMGANPLPDEISILNALPYPVAVIQGENDALVNNNYFTTAGISNLWNGAVQYIRECGHCVSFEQPQYFAGQILNYAKKTI